MDRIVADASVIVKLFLQEEYSEKAYALRDSYISEGVELIEPILLQYEVLSALRFSKSEKVTEEDMKEAMEAVENYNLKMVPPNKEIMEKALSYSLKYGTSIYDSIYVAVADAYKATLYTADSHLVEIKKPFVKHIKDYKQHV